jgi:hypothetical protein
VLVNKQAQYVLDTTMHKQTNTICIGHHYAQTNKHNMYWTPLDTQTITICIGHHYAHTNKHNMCWTPLYTNKQAQYVLYCVCLFVYSGVQYILCLFVCVEWCPTHIVFVCLCIVVSITYCACLFVHSGVQYILCLFVCI